jgi:hypothetical protein
MELRKVGLIGACIGFAVGMLAMSGSEAGAAVPGPKVSIHFYQNMAVDGQQVSVTGRHFLANEPLVAVTECSAGVETGDIGACSLVLGTGTGDLYLTTSSASGEVSMSVPHNSYYIRTGSIGDGTCNAGETCFIAVAVLNPSNPAGGPLQFALAPFVVG